ncbi:hypothetical protein [Nonomuraea dietziae]
MDNAPSHVHGLHAASAIGFVPGDGSTDVPTAAGKAKDYVTGRD